MTRASNPSSMATGWRSCRITRSMSSSSACSNMLRLSQESLQLFAGALDSHLQGRNPRPGEPRDLLVFEVLNVLEQKRLSVFRRQSRHRPVHNIVPFQPIDEIGTGRLVQSAFDLPNEQPATP